MTLTEALDTAVSAAEEINDNHRACSKEPLKCPGVGRDKDCITALRFYFSRPVTDDEIRFLHEVIQRAVACAPKGSGH